MLLGSILNFEDRKLSSMHLAHGYDGTPGARCALPAPANAEQKARSQIAGVFVHATVVRNLLEHDAVTEISSPLRLMLTVLFAAIIAAAACLLAPTGAAIAWLGLTVAYAAVAISTFAHAIALPLTEPALAGLAALGLMIGYRFVIADREERFLRKSFAFYLAPEVIESMVASGKMPVLGGEMRNITMFFSDLSGFSSIAEKMTPGELVALMNDYLSAMTDIIESHGGYVDKYIGDSVVAMFGAPADDPDHARHAVAAALECRDRLEELNENHPAFRGRGLAHRIGLNSGEAVVGNIGSRRRFNYTVMSDTVNLASRLEGANKYFGTTIMASEATVNQSRDAFTWRELDTVRVQGRDEPITVYEPLAEKSKETQEQDLRAATYAKGLACWRARDFAKAAELFETAAGHDQPSRYFAKRARTLAASPPPADWDAGEHARRKIETDVDRTAFGQPSPTECVMAKWMQRAIVDSGQSRYASPPLSGEVRGLPAERRASLADSGLSSVNVDEIRLLAVTGLHPLQWSCDHWAARDDPQHGTGGDDGPAAPVFLDRHCGLGRNDRHACFPPLDGPGMAEALEIYSLDRGDD